MTSEGTFYHNSNMSGETPDIQQMTLADYEGKLAERGAESQYYSEKVDELGLSTMDRFRIYHPEPSPLMQSGVTFAHRDLESVADAIANGAPWSVVSGLNPSGPLHFGHKQVFDELLWCQQQGAEIFIPITNDESYLVGKAQTLAESRRTAYEEIIPSIIALGFDPDKTHIFVDSDYKDIYNVAIEVAREISLSRALGVFGLSNNEAGENAGTVFYRAGVQLAQILLPQYVEFGGRKPTLVPVGIDQYPYVHLARDAAKRKGLIPPAATFTKFEEGLDGKGKMSASRPEAAIFLNEDVQTAQKKIKTAYTGGSILADFQREHGGVPEICPIYQLRANHFPGNENLRNLCSNGEILCGQCKKGAMEEVADYLNDHQDNLPGARERVNEFLLKTPIDSVLEDPDL